MSGSNQKPKILLHICCIGCGAYVSQVLQEEYEPILYFYNPNIFPQEEYEKRLAETQRVAKKYDYDIIIGEYDHAKWLEKVKGLENEPEKGKRCLICYEDRLRMTAKRAQENNIQYFTTTLTVSPHKIAQEIFRIGEKLAKEYGIEFVAQDFKKKDGFKKASQISRELELYRQNYCGCEFSMHN